MLELPTIGAHRRHGHKEHLEFEGSLVYIVTHHLNKERREKEKDLEALSIEDCQNSHVNVSCPARHTEASASPLP